MSGESQPPGDGEEKAEDEGAARREELLAKVREANRQSRTGPDSPTPGRAR